MGRNTREFTGAVDVPMSEVNEYIPSDFDDHDRESPVRMKHIDSETFANSNEADPKRYENLRESIRKNGVKTPIEATRLDGGETLLTEGHHRAVFARELGIKTIPVRFR